MTNAEVDPTAPQPPPMSVQANQATPPTPAQYISTTECVCAWWASLSKNGKAGVAAASAAVLASGVVATAVFSFSLWGMALAEGAGYAVWLVLLALTVLRQFPSAAAQRPGETTFFVQLHGASFFVHSLAAVAIFVCALPYLIVLIQGSDYGPDKPHCPAALFPASFTVYVICAVFAALAFFFVNLLLQAAVFIFAACARGPSDNDDAGRTEAAYAPLTEEGPGDVDGRTEAPYAQPSGEVPGDCGDQPAGEEEVLGGRVLAEESGSTAGQGSCNVFWDNFSLSYGVLRLPTFWVVSSGVCVPSLLAIGFLVLMFTLPLYTKYCDQCC